MTLEAVRFAGQETRPKNEGVPDPVESRTPVEQPSPEACSITSLRFALRCGNGSNGLLWKCGCMSETTPTLARIMVLLGTPPPLLGQRMVASNLERGTRGP